MSRISMFFWGLFFPLWMNAQFSVHLSPFSIDKLDGLHSFAFAEHGEKWLLMGGRIDGLHGKYSGFGKAMANTTVYVVDPIQQQVWSASIENLPTVLKEQLQSANMEFIQKEETLLFIGGYGESELADDYITYPSIIFIDIPALMNDIIMGKGVDTTHFQRIEDDYYAICGGQVQKIDDTFYLVGGHRFDGLYVTGWGGNVVQEYSTAIRKFKINTTNEGFAITDKEEIIDEVNLHRRDYNLVSQIMLDGSLGMTMFSGVFQPEAVLPFLNLCNISENGHQPVNNFNQHLANYTCARVPLYDKERNEMHTLFFGGISRYYYENGMLIDDRRMPFVKTISCVTRNADGRYEEYALDQKLPAFIGTNAEFILNPHTPLYKNEIIDLSKVEGDSILLGYIFGGIVSPDSLRNPYVNNQVAKTYPANTIFKVYLKPSLSTAIGEVIEAGGHSLDVHLSPNPAIDKINLELTLPESGDLQVWIQHANGKLLNTLDFDHQLAGRRTFQINLSNYSAGTYFITSNLGGKYLTTKKIVVE